MNSRNEALALDAARAAGLTLPLGVQAAEAYAQACRDGLADADDWAHRHECIRMTFTQPEMVVREGIAIIADEVMAKASREARAGVVATALHRSGRRGGRAG